MAKNALCIGINDYPGVNSDLLGCVNDANDWANELMSRGFEVQMMLDSDATKENMLSDIERLIGGSKAGDSIVITYSGHGTFVPDTSGDEPDGQDEGLCPYDIGQGNVLVDDDIHQLFKKRADGARIILISDSCHSGSVIRMAAPDPDSDGPRARFLPPSIWMALDKLPHSSSGNTLEAIQPQLSSQSPWVHALSFVGGDLLLAGCRDTEYSYDASFRNRPNGAFTYYALKTLKRLHANATYSDWYKSIRNYLPGVSYPQTPQIMGSKQARKFKVLD